MNFPIDLPQDVATLEQALSWMRMLSQVLDRIEEGVHVVDATGKTIWYNGKMEEMEGMNRHEVIGKAILDVFRFSDVSGSTLLDAIQKGKETKNIRQTYFNNLGTAITTINNTYPLYFDDRVIGAVEIASNVTKVERLQENLFKEPKATYTFEDIITNNSAMLEVIEQARRTARTDSSVLIIGETGTGKELLTQSIHQASPRSAGPLLSQNCAALPESLIEGLLFGTVRGAFTGAIDRPGLIEQANGGTLLLDELNSLEPSLQAKLLRVIQERSLRRVGDTKDRMVDVRVLATINEDPLQAIQEGKLRADLYYRLSVVSLLLPPLRDRQDDIPLLIQALIDKYNHLFQLHVKGIAPRLQGKMLAYDWPGNVRELEHIIQGAMNFVQGEEWLDLIHLPFYLRRKWQIGESLTPATHVLPALNDQPIDLREQVEQYELTYLKEVLANHQGNITATAKALGMTRQNLQYYLRKYDLRK